MKTIILLLVGSFLTLPSHSQTKEKDSLRDAFNLIDLWLEAQIEYDNIPGLSVGIVKGQEVLWSKGYGYADSSPTLRDFRERPMRPTGRDPIFLFLRGKR